MKMEYFTELINELDDIIRKNKKIDYQTQKEALQKLQSLHYYIKLAIENK